MKELRGDELAGFIKQRHLDRVKYCISNKVRPRLAIIHVGDDPTSLVYMRLKQAYATDIGIDIELVQVDANDLEKSILIQNQNQLTHGVIVQLPALGVKNIEKVLQTISPEKDVDSLGKDSLFVSATAEAILWLLSGNSIDLKNKNITVVGQGKLVGGPLSILLEKSGINANHIDEHTEHKSDLLRESDIVISAVGIPNIIQNDDIKVGAVIVDAGVTADKGSLVGDVSEKVRLRKDITITPKRGGVGPLTIAVLFDHVLTAAEKAVPSKAA